MMCADLFGRLSEYLDGDLTEAACRQVRAHVTACPRCERLCAQLAETIDLCHRLPAAPLPEPERRRLRLALERALAAARR